MGFPDEPILASVDTFDLKLLTRFDAVLLPNFGGEYNLPFA
jgi:hypothetical protein